MITLRTKRIEIANTLHDTESYAYYYMQDENGVEYQNELTVQLNYFHSGIDTLLELLRDTEQALAMIYQKIQQLVV